MESEIKFANGKPIPELVRFDVQFDRPRQTFFSGDVVSGEVRIQLAECLTIKGIIVRFVGEAYVYVPSEEPPQQWDVRTIAQFKKAFCVKNKVRPEARKAASAVSFATPASEHPSNGGSLLTDGVAPPPPPKPLPKNKIAALKAQQQGGSFRSTEKYFEHKFYVFGHKYSSMKESLWPGVHAFPFQYTLPTKLPTSFHGRYGYVRYYCEASLERPWLPSVKRKAYFSVSANADVNLESKAESSAGGQRSSNQCFFCCSRGTVVVEAKISKRGYVPGERIFIDAEVANMSSDRVTSTTAKLVQVTTYHSSKGFRHRADEIVVTAADGEPVPAGESATWQKVALPVPSLPASFSLNDCCKVLDVEYRLDFVVDIRGHEEPLVISMPIVVGTVPLQRAFKSLQMPDPLQGSPLARMTNLKYKGFPAVFSVACIWGPKSVDGYYHREIPRAHEDGVRVCVPGDTFAPRYVCYRDKDDAARASAELLAAEATPAAAARSRAASLQPVTTAPRHQPQQRFAHSSVHLSTQPHHQPQPINDPIIRSLAQLQAYQEASTSSANAHLSADNLGMRQSASVHTFGRRTAASSAKRLDASSAQVRSARSVRPSSSTSDGFWDVKGDIATISDRLQTAPSASANIDPSHMNY